MLTKLIGSLRILWDIILTKLFEMDLTSAERRMMVFIRARARQLFPKSEIISRGKTVEIIVLPGYPQKYYFTKAAGGIGKFIGVTPVAGAEYILRKDLMPGRATATRTFLWRKGDDSGWKLPYLSTGDLIVESIEYELDGIPEGASEAWVAIYGRAIGKRVRIE